jgi:hypothetical protein
MLYKKNYHLLWFCWNLNWRAEPSCN